MSDRSSSVQAPLYLRRPLDLEPVEERLLKRGPQSTSTADLLGYVTGLPHDDARVRAAADLVRQRALPGGPPLVLREFRRIPDVEATHAARFAAVFELARRAYRPDNIQPEPPKLTRPYDVWSQVRDLAGLRKEHLVGLYLDAQNGFLHRETLSVGNLNICRTHPREILLPAIQHSAFAFILAHNHPSGCLDPSEEDLEFTLSVRRAGELMGIDLYDHVIVTAGGYTSLREQGVL